MRRANGISYKKVGETKIMEIKSIRRVKNLVGKKVFLRVDFNVPIKDEKIADDYKIVATLSTIRFLLRYKCKIIIATHLEPGKRGKEKGKRGKCSVKLIAKHLEKLLGRKITFMDDCIGLKVARAASKMKAGDILMLENLRFHKEEKENDKNFARQLAGLADIHVNDAFATSHRAHASVSAIKKYIPAYAGLLLENEILNLSKILKPNQPLVAVMGGAKISAKLSLLKKLLQPARYILTGGGLANNFLAASGHEVGQSLIASEEIELAKKIKSTRAGRKIILPTDVVVSDKKDGSGRARVKKTEEVGEKDIILDIGPETMKSYAVIIKKAKTIVWNGPLGMFEAAHFRHGTLVIGRVIAAKSKGEAFGIAGGGETITALKMTKMMDYMDWVSTGGGAMLAFLGGERMPGLEGIVK